MHRDNKTAASARPGQQVLTVTVSEAGGNVLQATRVNNDVKDGQDTCWGAGVGMPEFQVGLVRIRFTSLLNYMIGNINGYNLKPMLCEPRAAVPRPQLISSTVICGANQPFSNPEITNGRGVSASQRGRKFGLRHWRSQTRRLRQRR